MFAKMKTARKFSAGLCSPSRFAVIVGLVGYRWINKLSGHVEEIVLVRMPSIVAMSSIKSGPTDQVCPAYLLNPMRSSPSGHGRRMPPNQAKAIAKLPGRLDEALPQAAEVELEAVCLAGWQNVVTRFSDSTEFGEIRKCLG